MNTKIRGFEPVITDKRKNPHCPDMPKRGTARAMAYDFYANNDYTVNPGEVAKIWTDVKAYMQPNEGLVVCIRSSMGGKYRLTNQIGIIDADYYSNPSNDGNIGVFLQNISGDVQNIHRGDRIAQGIFVPYLTADDDVVMHEERISGFGSTGK